MPRMLQWSAGLPQKVPCRIDALFLACRATRSHFPSCKGRSNSSIRTKPCAEAYPAAYVSRRMPARRARRAPPPPPLRTQDFRLSVHTKQFVFVQYLVWVKAKGDGQAIHAGFRT